MWEGSGGSFLWQGESYGSLGWMEVQLESTVHMVIGSVMVAHVETDVGWADVVSLYCRFLRNRTVETETQFNRLLSRAHVS